MGVNIQDTETFTSHCLNRDVWKDKELGPVIAESFIFYQWIKTTDNARRIINLYRPTAFPCILVLDPNTGRQDYEFAVPEEPDKVVTIKTKLLEFLDDYPNPKVKPKKRAAVPTIPKAQDMVAHMSHDDKLLQEALAASMADVDQGTDGKENHNSNSNNFNNEATEEMKMEVDDDDNQMVEQEPEEEEVNLEDLLEPEPEKNDPNATAIRIRMPTGGVAQRYFKKDALVQQLYYWSTLSLDGRAVSLLQTMPRLRLDDQKEKTLKELGLIRATLVCSFAED